MDEITNDLMDFLGDDLYIEETEETVEVEEAEEIDESEPEPELEELEEELDAEEVPEDEDEEIDEDEDEPEDEDEVEAPEEFELVIDGEEVRVTKEELTTGYLRNKDYLAKVTEAEEKIEKLRAEEEVLMKSKEVFAFSSHKQLADCEAAIAAEGGWLNIERTRDPVQVAQFKEMYQNIQNQAKLAETVEKEFKAKQEETYEADMIKVAKHLIKTVPNITKETFSEMDTYIADMGLPEDYARNIRNPVAWTMIHKAMMYDKAQVRKVSKEAPAPKRVKKNVTARKEQPSTTTRRSFDKKIGELKSTHTNKERNSAVAVSAIADLLRMG